MELPQASVTFMVMELRPVPGGIVKTLLVCGPDNSEGMFGCDPVTSNIYGAKPLTTESLNTYGILPH